MRIIVTVPRWGWGTATDIHVARSGILREECTILLPGGARRTMFMAVTPGSTWVGATVEPASDLAMPAWGGRVIVQPLPYQDQQRLATSLARKGALQEGLPETRATDIMWAIANPNTHHALISERRWTPNQYEQWLATF